MTGLNGVYGSMSSILSHFHWTLDYLMWGIPYNTVLKMMADAPSYKSGKKKKKSVQLNHDDLTKALQAKYMVNQINEVER